MTLGQYWTAQSMRIGRASALCSSRLATNRLLTRIFGLICVSECRRNVFVIFQRHSCSTPEEKQPVWFWSHGRHTEIILEVGPDLWQRFLFMAAPARPSSARPTNSWYRQGEMGKANQSFAHRLPTPKCISGSVLNQISAFFPSLARGCWQVQHNGPAFWTLT